VSGPRREAEAVAALASVPPWLPESSAVRARLGPRAERIVGPVFLGYRATAPELPAGEGVARPLVAADAAALARLRDAARPDEWEHAGFTIRRPVAGVFLGEILAAAAGFEVLGEGVAHLGVLSHPSFRRKGVGSRAVAAAAVLAHEAGYLLQYQTLESNGPSLGIAARLGFEPWGRSLTVRLATDGPASAG
jgi:GNAT superfamily N-acetyltransferase